jgi:hypothetical protein
VPIEAGEHNLWVRLIISVFTLVSFAKSTVLCVTVLLGSWEGKEGVMQMASNKVSPEEIAAIIEKASKEPGINDMMALLHLSQEATEVEQARLALTAAQPIIAHVSGTAGWVW